MKVVNTTKGTTLATHVTVACSFLQRAQGLLGKNSLPASSALVLASCNSVHTVGMRFPIDVVFLSKEGRIIKALHTLKPLRFTAVYWTSDRVIEFPAGTLQATKTTANDILAIE